MKKNKKINEKKYWYEKKLISFSRFFLCGIHLLLWLFRRSMMPGGVFSLLSIIFLFSSTNGGLNQLCELINFYDKAKHTAECITYDNYGCWCGPGGSGKPVDATDICCQRHDFCYDRILAKNECSPYLHQYEHSNGTCCKSWWIIFWKLFISICIHVYSSHWNLILY